MIYRAIREARKSLMNKMEHENKKEVDIDREDLENIFAEIKSARKKKAKSEAKKRERLSNAPNVRRYTEDGLPIYTEDELQMNNPKAGTTPLCPFDCDCCH